MGFLLQLSKLERGGRLERRKNGAFAIAAESTMLGRLMSLSRGFGFARLDDGSGDGRHTASSSLYFEAPQHVTWLPVFRETPCEGLELKLL